MKLKSKLTALSLFLLTCSSAQAYYGMYAFGSNGVFGWSVGVSDYNYAKQYALQGCRNMGGTNCVIPKTRNGHEMYADSGMYMSIARSSTSMNGRTFFGVGYSFDPQQARDIAFNNCKALSRGHYRWTSKGANQKAHLPSSCSVVYHQRNYIY